MQFDPRANSLLRRTGNFFAIQPPLHGSWRFYSKEFCGISRGQIEAQQVLLWFSSRHDVIDEEDIDGGYLCTARIKYFAIEMLMIRLLRPR
jgi:hypothetical protein